MAITTEVCRRAVVDWLLANGSPDEFDQAGFAHLLREKEWKRRTKVVRNGETVRSFTNGSALDACLASVEVVETKAGNLIVRVDSVTQPPGFLNLLAIKTTVPLETKTVDRGETWGSW